MTPDVKQKMGQWLTVVFLFAWGTVLVAPTLVREYYQLTDREPWMEISLSFDDAVGEDGWPTLNYSRTITKPATGEWFAWVDTLNSDSEAARICGGSGVHAYDVADSGVIQMEMTYFLGTDCRTTPPTLPFRVCARYILRDDNDLQSRVGPVCTPYNKRTDQT